MKVVQVLVTNYTETSPLVESVSQYTIPEALESKADLSSVKAFQDFLKLQESTGNPHGTIKKDNIYTDNSVEIYLIDNKLSITIDQYVGFSAIIIANTSTVDIFVDLNEDCNRLDSNKAVIHKF